MEWREILSSRWGISFCLSALTLITLIGVLCIRHNKRISIVTPGRVLFLGVFFSAFAYFMPLYLADGMDGFPAVMASFQHSFRIFGLDGDFVSFVNEKCPESISDIYIKYGLVLYAFAPLLTFGFILTFFKNFFAHLKYKASILLRAHVFSELNEKSLALAESILRKNKPFLGFIPKVLIVFTDIIDKKEELHLDLVEKAKEIGAVLFRKDLESVKFKHKWSFRRVNFYLISENELEKIRHAEHIMNRYDDKNVSLWVFSDDIRTDLMLTQSNPDNIDVKRVNDIQSLIYHNLDMNGSNLFTRSREINGKKVISVVILGLGKYGQEMLKALAWYCQLGGYTLKINAFDVDKKADEKFRQMCPELLDGRYNKTPNPVEGEAYYEIEIHNDIDVSTPDFEEKFKQIDDATYVFVCLGDDKTNLDVASKIRIMCERIGYKGDGRKPAIETVIYDPSIREKLGKTWESIEDAEPNRKKKRNEYDVLMIGDLNRFYSVETFSDSELLTQGFAVHAFWSVEPAKIAFAEEHMAKEWNEFLKAENLEASWKDHCCKMQRENENSEEKVPLKFSDFTSKFSFMTMEEISEKEKLEGKDKTEENKKRLIGLRNIVAERNDRWEKQVYKKFKELTSIKKYAKEWQKIEENKKTEAKKSFRNEYNYRSSIAKAIHVRLRKKLNFKPEITGKAWEDMTLEEKIEIGKIEHVRWNAYMRSEGYRYAPKRNDLARLHHNLVPTGELSNDDLRKDA